MATQDRHPLQSSGSFFITVNRKNRNSSENIPSTHKLFFESDDGTVYCISKDRSLQNGSTKIYFMYIIVVVNFTEIQNVLDKRKRNKSET